MVRYDLHAQAGFPPQKWPDVVLINYLAIKPTPEISMPHPE